MVFCNIHQRTRNAQTGEYEYQVSLNFHMDEPDRTDKRKFIDTGVPQSAIFFVDKPYQSDLHLPNAFRHPIELREDLVPEEWVRKKET